MSTFKYIGIETTTVCNSECSCCPRSSQYEHRFTTMPMQLFKKIIIDIRDNHEITSLLRFGGMGDASCDKLLLERLRFLKEEAPNLKFGLSSNMSGWKKRYTDIIISEQLTTHMRFSILAYSEEGSQKIYGKRDQAAQARESIDYFIDANNKAGHPLWIEVYTLLFAEFEKEVDLIREKYWDVADEFEVWRPHSWANRFPTLRANQPERRPCASVSRMDQPLIGIHGDVVPCSMDINYVLSLGNLNEQSLESIIHGEKCNELQNINKAGKIEELNTCKGCVYLNASSSDVLIESKSHEISLDRHISD